MSQDGQCCLLIVENVAFPCTQSTALETVWGRLRSVSFKFSSLKPFSEEVITASYGLHVDESPRFMSTLQFEKQQYRKFQVRTVSSENACKASPQPGEYLVLTLTYLDAKLGHDVCFPINITYLHYSRNHDNLIERVQIVVCGIVCARMNSDRQLKIFAHAYVCTFATIHRCLRDGFIQTQSALIKSIRDAYLCNVIAHVLISARNSR